MSYPTRFLIAEQRISRKSNMLSALGANVAYLKQGQAEGWEQQLDPSRGGACQ